MKKKMVWYSLLSLVLLKIFALYKGLKFDILPQIDDIFIYLGVWLNTILASLVFFKKKINLYSAFLIGCLYQIFNVLKITGSYEGSPEESLHALGVISLLVFIVTLINFEKKGMGIDKKNINNINN